VCGGGTSEEIEPPVITPRGKNRLKNLDCHELLLVQARDTARQERGINLQQEELVPEIGIVRRGIIALRKAKNPLESTSFRPIIQVSAASNPSHHEAQHHPPLSTTEIERRVPQEDMETRTLKNTS